MSAFATFRPIGLSFGIGLLLAVGAPSSADAQAVVVDEGSFRLTVGGREVGTETFTIRSTGSGPGLIVIAQGSVALDTAGTPQDLRTVLRAEGQAPSLRPVAYEMTVHEGEQEKIAGRIVGGRFSALIRSGTGEQMREYLASEGAVLVDEGVAHHHYFLAQRAVAGSTVRVPLLIPRQNRQISAEVTETGPDTVEIGNQRLPARRISILPAGGAERLLWVDAQGRVLRLEIPARGFTARRTAAPR